MVQVTLVDVPVLSRTKSLTLRATNGFAKVLETFGKPIFAAGHIVSGHTLKYLAAAGYCILRTLQKASTSVAFAFNYFNHHP